MRIPWIERDLLYGAKLVQDKAQLGTEMSAERAIKRAVVKLQGGNRRHEVNFTTGEPSVDEHQGDDQPGEGFWTLLIAERGDLSDSPLVSEGFSLARASLMALYLTISGRIFLIRSSPTLFLTLFQDRSMTSLKKRWLTSLGQSIRFIPPVCASRQASSSSRRLSGIN